MLLRRRQATATARFERALDRFETTLTSRPMSSRSRRCGRCARRSAGPGSGSRQERTHARLEVVAHPRDIILLLRGHIRKKDGGIFPLLDELLGSASKVANHA